MYNRTKKGVISHFGKQQQIAEKIVRYHTLSKLNREIILRPLHNMHEF